jgi:HlyD family secretion protein
MLRKLVMLLVVGGVISLVVFALKPRPIEVEVGVVQNGPLTVDVSEEGKTRIRNRHIVAAPVAGSMQRVTLKPGDKVESGETVLTRIEPVLAPLLDARSHCAGAGACGCGRAARSRANERNRNGPHRTEIREQANWDRVKNNTDKGTISDTDRDTFEREAEMKAREVRAVGIRSAGGRLRTGAGQSGAAAARITRRGRQSIEVTRTGERRGAACAAGERHDRRPRHADSGNR